jgi:oxygen-independent coproporphyrinogen-3 oxidase
MRCGFCNLFTTANPRDEVAAKYIETVTRQAKRVADAVGPLKAARMAVGGGTPTYLSADDLERLLRIPGECFGVMPGSVPLSVETSPGTADFERLSVLKSVGTTRVSIGVQSFVEAEVAASARAQKNTWVEAALGRIRDFGFESLNIDLMYGLPGQTVQTFLTSVRAALGWLPEELYLYPLYVREGTGLDRRGCLAHDAVRLHCYRAGRELLLAEGYEQISMRMFRRPVAEPRDGPIYCCQDDGMLGLGCGARSYTRQLHYSTDYAVSSTGVREIIADYLERTDEQLAHADYGCEVSEAEHRRRWLIKSLFRASGLDRGEYLSAFGADALDDFPQLTSLAAENYFRVTENRICPTPLGLEWSDALGPMLFSDSIKTLMAGFALR